MRRMVAVAVVMVFVAACGGGDAGIEGVGDGGAGETPTTAPGGDGGGESAEPVGPADMNTIRIGSDVWERTLPMTTGQCFLPAQDGSNPVNGTVWGTLDGNDDLRFAVRYQGDGSHEAEVSDGVGIYWLAGARAGGADDLELELDFEAQTIRGQGTFTSLTTGETAGGSFAFQCEPEG